MPNPTTQYVPGSEAASQIVGGSGEQQVSDQLETDAGLDLQTDTGVDLEVD